MSKVILLIEALVDSLMGSILVYHTLMLAYYDRRDDPRWTYHIKRIAYIVCFFAVTSILTFIIRVVIPQFWEQ